MAYTLRPILTPKREAWLLQLRDKGPAASHSVVGFACRKLGWSEWFIKLKGRDPMPISEAYALYPERHLMWADREEEELVQLECITDAGRQALYSAGL